jgi:fatty acid synthase subunit alpha, fungi type
MGGYIYMFNHLPQSSFGFSQVGGTTLVPHPHYIFSTLKLSAYTAYRCKNETHTQQAYKSMSEMMITNSLVKIKGAPPYTPELKVPVLMNLCGSCDPQCQDG